MTRLVPQASPLTGRLVRVAPCYFGLDATGGILLQQAGVALAIALQLCEPTGKIAATWLLDGTLGVAVFYDPATHGAWDGAGWHHDVEWRTAHREVARVDMDAAPAELAAAVQLPFDPADPWASGQLCQALEFAHRWFGAQPGHPA